MNAESIRYSRSIPFATRVPFHSLLAFHFIPFHYNNITVMKLFYLRFKQQARHSHQK